MKNNVIIKSLAAVAIAASLGAAAIGGVCSFASTVSASSAEETKKPEKPEHDGKYTGKITAIDTASITIETMGGPMEHGHKPDGGKPEDGETPPEAPTNADGTVMTPPELPTNADGTTMTPPELPTNADGTVMTPPELPTNADGTVMTPPEGEDDRMGGSRSMTFSTSVNYTSDFSVGDMVEITSADGAAADSVSTAKLPEKKEE